MDWSFQLYSARNFQPWSAVLAMLARHGYRQVEGFPGAYADPPGLRAELDRYALAMPTGHFPLDMIENDFQEVTRIASALGIGLLICPHLDAGHRPTDAAGWSQFGKRLAAAARTAKAAGFGFAWHNHDFEFEPLADGSLPLEHVLSSAPGTGWEIDVAWVVRSGADPLPWIERFGRRIVAVHVKDIARRGEGLNEDGWADVGHGSMDWKGLLRTLRQKSAARCYVMEQDNPSDVERFARRSIEAVRAF